jgi:hypothetical protein
MAIAAGIPKDGHAGPANRFDFLGYRFSSADLVRVAVQTVVRCVERTPQLYEQGADDVRIGDYVRRWLVWVRSGLDGLVFAVVKPSPYAVADKMPLRVPAVPWLEA